MKCLHDLVLSEAGRSFGAFHCFTAVGEIGVADMGQAKRATSVLVSREFGCAMVS